MGKNVISTQSAPAAVGPYSQAIGTEQFLFLSGQLGLDPQSPGLRFVPWREAPFVEWDFPDWSPHPEPH